MSNEPRYGILILALVVILSACGGGLLVLWWERPAAGVAARVPGADAERTDGEPERRGDAGMVLAGAVSPSSRLPVSASVRTAANGKLVTGAGVPSSLPGDWPRFRGPDADGVGKDGTPLARQWPKEGPRALWTIDVGEGYAGAAVHAGRVYLLDYDRENQADVLRCLSLADGKDIWRYSYPVVVKRNHGMSRTVPAVNDKYVVSLGPKCHVLCLDAQTGQRYWALDLVKDFGAKVPLWYAGQCPLLDRDRAILAPCGEALLMAVNCKSGEILWKTPNPLGWTMTHSSILPLELQGRHIFFYCGSGGVAVVSDSGEMLWQSDLWVIKEATVPSPVNCGDGRVFLSGGYDAGSLMLKLDTKHLTTEDTEDAGNRSALTYASSASSVVKTSQLMANELFRLKAAVFGATQQTPIFYAGHIFGVRPDGQLTCLAGDGTPKWASGAGHKFGLGPLLIANGLLYVMNDSGLLTMVEATPEAYRPLAQAQVLTGHDAWGPMALAGGRLIVRDLTRMVCLDVAKAGQEKE